MIGVAFFILNASVASWSQPAQHRAAGPPSVSQQLAQPQPQPGTSPDPATINSMSAIVKLALDTNNETVKRIETFYSNTIQDFVYHITLAATLVGLVGLASVVLMARMTAKKQSKKILTPYKSQLVEFSSQSSKLIEDYNSLKADYQKLQMEINSEQQAYRDLSSSLTEFQKSAVSNLHGLRSAMLAWYIMMLYMQNRYIAPPGEESKWNSKKEEARKYILTIINDIQPNDAHMLSLTHSVYGIILFIDGNFRGAAKSFAEAVAKNEANVSAALNGACCACKLAEESERANDVANVSRLEAEALKALKAVLSSEPWRKDEIRIEGDSGDLQRLKNHPDFKALVQ